MKQTETEKQFVAVEGPDGCGKTSQSKKLAEYLKAAWRRFPNRDTPIGKLIGDHLNHGWAATRGEQFPMSRNPPGDKVMETVYRRDDALDALVFQALQTANRYEAREEFVQTLKTQHIVCDRYWPSGYAYGKADGLNTDYLFQIHKGLLQPDLFILFDIDPEISFKRIGERAAREGRDRYEGSLDFTRKVVENYRGLWERNFGDPRWVRIDANGTLEETWARLQATVRHLAPTKIG